MFLLLSDKNSFNVYFTSIDFIYFLSLYASLMQSNRKYLLTAFTQSKLYIFTEKEVYFLYLENNCNVYTFIKQCLNISFYT